MRIDRKRASASPFGPELSESIVKRKAPPVNLAGVFASDLHRFHME